MKKEKQNISASVKAKLFNLAKSNQVDFNRVLTSYFHERFLARLSKSKHCESLILKGGALLMSFDVIRSRPTKDLDFLARKVLHREDELRNLIDDIISIELVDGVTFDRDSVVFETIIEESTFEVVRIKFNVYLEQARGRLQLDIGFEDAVFPEPVLLEYPVLLSSESPKIRAYSLETVVAEKLQAMIELGFLNSRIRDFYDMLFISRIREFNKADLIEAISKTFAKRNTKLGTEPIIFTENFINDKSKQTQWTAFLKRLSAHDMPESFVEVMKELKNFLLPVISPMSNN